MVACVLLAGMACMPDGGLSLWLFNMRTVDRGCLPSGNRPHVLDHNLLDIAVVSI